MSGRTLYDRARELYNLDDDPDVSGGAKLQTTVIKSDTGNDTVKKPTNMATKFAYPGSPKPFKNRIYIPVDPDDQSDDEVITTEAYDLQVRKANNNIAAADNSNGSGNGNNYNSREKQAKSRNRGRRGSHRRASIPSSPASPQEKRRSGQSQTGKGGKATGSGHGSTKDASKPTIAVPPLVKIPLPGAGKKHDLNRGEACREKGIAFCPWRIITKYPIWFVGRKNGELVAPYFQLAALVKCQAWDFYYLRHPSEAKKETYAIVVPTEQFQNLLDRINRTLNIQLSIPPGANTRKFRVFFGAQGTPVPRFLGRAPDNTAFRLLTSRLPALDPKDSIFTQSHVSVAARSMFLRKFDGLLQNYDKDQKKKDKFQNSQRKRARLRRDWGKQAKRLQRYLGLRGKAQPDSKFESVPMALDLTTPAPFEPDQEVVFVSMDIESYEFNHSLITEIGFGILDAKKTKGVAPGPSCENWYDLIQGRHIRILEYVTCVNRQFVHGCENQFNFGQSEFVKLADVPRLLQEILQPTTPSGEQRKVILVGHSINSDISLVKKVNFKIDPQDMFLEVVDTQALHQHWRMRANQMGLGGVLQDLDIENSFLHNGGNDAVYTLQAMISLVVNKRQASLCRHHEKLKPGHVIDPTVQEEGWESGGEMSDGGLPGENVPATDEEILEKEDSGEEEEETKEKKEKKYDRTEKEGEKHSTTKSGGQVIGRVKQEPAFFAEPFVFRQHQPD